MMVEYNSSLHAFQERSTVSRLWTYSVLYIPNCSWQLGVNGLFPAVHPANGLFLALGQVSLMTINHLAHTKSESTFVFKSQPKVSPFGHKSQGTWTYSLIGNDFWETRCAQWSEWQAWERIQFWTNNALSGRHQTGKDKTSFCYEPIHQFDGDVNIKYLWNSQLH